MGKLKIAPSTDPCQDKEELLAYVRKLNKHADLVHCDVMDENFVGHNTIGANDVADMYTSTLLPLDVHLMVREPYSQIKDYVKAGASIITVHFEAFKDKKTLIKCLKKIRSHKKLAGLAINPQTEVGEIMSYLAYADLVLVMSVNPGLSGQRFMESTFSKVKRLKSIREDYGARYKIEVDGGIFPEIAKNLHIQGADIVVSGNYVYSAEDRAKAIEDLRF